MKSLILKYNQLNESNELENLSFEEVERLVDLGLLNGDLLKIYEFVKNKGVGYLDLSGSKLTHLPNWLTKVIGKLNISGSRITDIPDNLEIIGDIFVGESALTEFRRTKVSGTLGLSYTKIQKLPDNLKIVGSLFVRYVNFIEIPKNLIVGETLYIKGSTLFKYTDAELRKMYDLRYISRTQ